VSKKVQWNFRNCVNKEINDGQTISVHGVLGKRKMCNRMIGQSK